MLLRAFLYSSTSLGGGGVGGVGVSSETVRVEQR